MTQHEFFETEGYLPEDQQETLDDARDTFDSSDVVLYSTDWTVGSVIHQIQRKRIDLNPAFQRRQAWQESHRSRFIESLILNIPIPQIVLAEDPAQKGYYIVIDGKQRLLALTQYVQNRQQNENNEAYSFKPYKLTGLSKGPSQTASLNGKYYDQLPTSVQAQIENTVLRTVIIRSVGNTRFLYEAFLRLNQGSKSLSPQELRQALAPGNFTNWLDDFVVNSKILQDALRITSADPRMRDTEVALRFMAYRENLDGYDGNFRRFLDDYMIQKNNEAVTDQLKEDLELALKTTMTIFGKNAFEKYDVKTSEFTGKFNRAVFDSMTFYFADPTIAALALTKAPQIIEDFKELCRTSRQYTSSVETSFKGVSETVSRLKLWGEKLQETLGVKVPAVWQDEYKIRVVR